MPDNIKIEIKNQDLVLKYIKRFPKTVRSEIYNVVEAELNDAAIAAKTIANASRYTGDLAEKISVVRDKDVIKYQSLSEHAAFAEFGIRSLAKPTRRYQNIAAQFKGLNIKSSGKTAKESIYEWAAFRGISKQFWYPIYRKLIGHPIKGSDTGYSPIDNGQGYFFRNLDIAIKNILKRSEEVIKRAIK
jgi:hypothetical protein